MIKYLESSYCFLLLGWILLCSFICASQFPYHIKWYIKNTSSIFYKNHSTGAQLVSCGYRYYHCIIHHFCNLNITYGLQNGLIISIFHRIREFWNSILTLLQLILLVLISTLYWPNHYWYPSPFNQRHTYRIDESEFFI